MRSRKIILAGAITVLVTVACVLWLLSLEPTRPDIGLSFVTYTTNSAGQAVAKVKLVNTGKATVRFTDTCMAVAENTGSRTPPTTTLDLTEVSLRPGDSTTVLVAPPLAHGPWRVGVGYYAKDQAAMAKTRTRLALGLGRLAPRFLLREEFYTWSAKYIQ